MWQKGMITWEKTLEKKKASIWIPYAKNLIKEKGRWRIEHGGGEVTINLALTGMIMFYGEGFAIPSEFLDETQKHKVCLIYHRRNMPNPIFIHYTKAPGKEDLLSRQITHRSDGRLCGYIAKTIVKAKLRSQKTGGLDAEPSRLSQTKNLNEIRLIEAAAAGDYWRSFYKEIGLKISRRDDHEVNKALDACSHFLAGLALRFILVQRLSPYHGFLHSDESYPGFIYDVIEPYRIFAETAVLSEYLKDGEGGLISRSIGALKEILEGAVFVPATREYAKRKNLIHGCILAIKAFLEKKVRRITIPMEGEDKPGRTPKAGYSVPGAKKYPLFGTGGTRLTDKGEEP